MLAGEEELAAGLGGGDRGGGHELGDLADGVGSQVVVAEVLGHAGACRDLRGAPGVQRVVDEDGPLEQAVVVGFDVEAAEGERQQRGGEGVGVELAVDVGGVDDAGQADEGRVAVEVVVVDEDLERALVVPVVVGGAGGVEAVGAFASCDGEDLVGGDVEDLGVGVDEPADQPRAGDPVGLGAGAGDPLHGWPPGREGVGPVGEAGHVEVAAGDLVAGDRPVVDGAVDVRGREGVAFGCRDPGVEHLVVGQIVTTTVSPSPPRLVQDELGEDAVGLRALRAPRRSRPDTASRSSGWYGDGAQAHDHAGLLGQRDRAKPAPQHQVVGALDRPAMTNGAPIAIDCAAPASSGPMGRVT